jgi:lysophospholipase L1-like esterase
MVFGDSITYGLADENGGWVSRLREIFDKKAFKQFKAN